MSQDSLTHTIQSIKQLLPKYPLKTLNAKEAIEGNWVKDGFLFVMPGGADLPYCKKLNGQGNKIIKQFVNSGGGYLGICAGAYYGASYVEFDKDGTLEVLGNRELAFVDAKAIGPALAKYDYRNNSGARAVEVKMTNCKNAVSYFNGGCFFEIQKKDKVSIIGTYTSINKPAIIKTKYGKGIVILSGVHFEYDLNFMNQNDPYLKKIIPALDQSSVIAKEIFKSFRLGK